jgi:hypothetical protein
MHEEHRGLRFAFSVSAEIAPEGSVSAFFSARVTELSLRGCFIETSVSFELQRAVLPKIHHSEEDFEAEAAVLYVKPSGLDLLFREIRPHCREILQKWVLTALNNHASTSQTFS